MTDAQPSSHAAAARKRTIFISCAAGNNERVRQMTAALEADGFEIQRDCDPPAEPPQGAAIDMADAVVVCWTPAACSSDIVVQEAMQARHRGRLVQVMLVPCKPHKPFSNRLDMADLTRWRGDANDPQIRTLCETILAKIEHRLPRLFVWRTRLVTWGGAGLAAAAIIAVLASTASLKRTWDTFTGATPTRADIASLGERIDAQDMLVESMVKQFVADARARGEELDESSIDAFRQAVTDLLASGDQRKIEAVTRFSAGAKTEAFRDLETLAHEQEAVAKAQLERSAESWKQIGALAYAAEPDRAREAYERTLALTPDDPYSLNELGRLHMRAGRVEEAEASFQRILELPVKNGDKSWHALAYSNLGAVALVRGDLVKAEHLHAGALALHERMKKPGRQATALANLAAISMQRGDFGAAEALYRRATTVESTIQNPGEPAFERRAVVYLAMGEISSRKGDASAAEAFFRRSAEMGRQSGIPLREAVPLVMLGGSLLTRDEIDAAEDSLTSALSIFEKIENERGQAAAIAELSGVKLKRGDVSGAAILAERARNLYERLGDAENEANSLVNLGAIAEQNRNLKLAEKHWRRALTIYRTLGRTQLVAQMSEWLRSIGADPDKPGN